MPWVTRTAPSGQVDLIDRVGKMKAMKRRRSILQLVKTDRRPMPPPCAAFRDRRRVEKAHRQRYGAES